MVFPIVTRNWVGDRVGRKPAWAVAVISCMVILAPGNDASACFFHRKASGCRSHHRATYAPQVCYYGVATAYPSGQVAIVPTTTAPSAGAVTATVPTTPIAPPVPAASAAVPTTPLASPPPAPVMNNANAGVSDKELRDRILTYLKDNGGEGVTATLIINGKPADYSVTVGLRPVDGALFQHRFGPPRKVERDVISFAPVAAGTPNQRKGEIWDYGLVKVWLYNGQILHYSQGLK